MISSSQNADISLITIGLSASIPKDISLGVGTTATLIHRLGGGTTKYAVESAARDLVKHWPEEAETITRLLRMRLGKE